MSKIPKLPKDSIHQPTSNSPSPSEGLLKATQPDDLRKDYTDKLSKEMGEVGDHQIDPINHTQPDNTIDSELEHEMMVAIIGDHPIKYNENGERKAKRLRAAIDKYAAQEANKARLDELESIRISLRDNGYEGTVPIMIKRMVEFWIILMLLGVVAGLLV